MTHECRRFHYWSDGAASLAALCTRNAALKFRRRGVERYLQTQIVALGVMALTPNATALNAMFANEVHRLVRPIHKEPVNTPSKIE
jgi:hypothetical protein